MTAVMYSEWTKTNNLRWFNYVVPGKGTTRILQQYCTRTRIEEDGSHKTESDWIGIEEEVFHETGV